MGRGLLGGLGGFDLTPSALPSGFKVQRCGPSCFKGLFSGAGSGHALSLAPRGLGQWELFE